MTEKNFRDQRETKLEARSMNELSKTADYLCLPLAFDAPPEENSFADPEIPTFFGPRNKALRATHHHETVDVTATM